MLRRSDNTGLYALYNLHLCIHDGHVLLLDFCMYNTYTNDTVEAHSCVDNILMSATLPFKSSVYTALKLREIYVHT